MSAACLLPRRIQLRGQTVTDEAVESYALDMVLSGAESTIEDDLNESDELTPEQHTRAREFGYALLRAIRDHRAALLRTAREVYEPDEPEPGLVAGSRPEEGR